MRYIGRHRAPRPIYLRRPVVGGVLVAALITVPTLALTGQTPGLRGAEPAPSQSPSSSTSNPAVVVPTDGELPSDVPATSSRTSAPSSPVRVTSAAATTTARTTTPVRTTPALPPSKTPSSTTTKPAPVPDLKTSLSAPDGTVLKRYSGSISASGGTGSYRFSSSARPAWLSFVSTASKATFTGTPPADGPVSFTVTVRSGSKTQSVIVAFDVAPAVVVPPLTP